MTWTRIVDNKMRGHTLPTSYSRNARSFSHSGRDSDLLTESLFGPCSSTRSQRETLFVRRRLFVGALCMRVSVHLLSCCMWDNFFNAAFSIMKTQFDLVQGTEIWHLIGLWPGLFIFAQYALGLLVATDIFVSNNILHDLDEADSHNGEDAIGTHEEDREDKKLVVLAVLAWFVRRFAHVISLVLIFNVGIKDGFLHAAYMIFFLLCFVSSSVGKATRQSLILLCELLFALLYILRRDWISTHLADHTEAL